MLDIFNHKDIPLYVVDIPYGVNRTHTEYFTRIPWGEYKRIRFAERVQSLSPYDLKIKIFRDYTVRDPKWTDKEIDILPAGIVETVADLIMYVSDSGIIPDREGNINIPAFTTRLNMYRAISSTNVEYQMYTVICLVFRAYTFEMLDKLPFDRIASLFASAERYLLENGILKQPLEIYNPTEQKGAKAIPVPKKEKMVVKDEEEAENSIMDQILKMREEEAKKSQPKPQVKEANKVTPSYIPPKDNVVVSNGVQVKVPGIKIDKENELGGFEDKDFAGPFMDENEALALQMEMGLMPSGYDLYIKRQEIESAKNIKESESTSQKIKTRRKFKRQ